MDAPRVWVDDEHPIFRRGIVSCLLHDGLPVVGESAGLVPAPRIDAMDVLVFEAEGTWASTVTDLVAGTGVRLVAVVPAMREQVVYEAVDAGVAAVLLRNELHPSSLLGAIHAAASGSTAVPSSLVPRLLERAAQGAAGSGRSLSDREVAVLRLLSEGEDTQDIGTSLGYSERTVKNIVHDLLMKMNCRNRVHAVALATRQGLI